MSLTNEDLANAIAAVESIRETALRKAYSSLKSITHGHDVQVQRNRGDKNAVCSCTVCQARRETEKALETYEGA